jgi:putative methyltransferase
MKTIYFVQIAISSYKYTAYLPYASGCLIAYAMQDDEISSAYKFNDIIFMRDKIDTAMQSVDEPYLVAFSCAIGNIEYSKIFAQKIKEKYPACLIVFGGHGIFDNIEFLEKHRYADFSVCGEGEHAFSALLKCLLHDRSLNGIDNLAYRTAQGIINNKASNNFDIENYPSPYLTGIFNNLFNKYPGIEFHSIIETNRGCPYNCAFCEWCFTKNIRYFPLERVKKEIDWMSEKHIEYCYCADANFGITFRDIEIAEYVVSTRKKNGYPAIFRPTYAKNSNETVFEAGRILNLNGADKGVTIAYQSLSEKTLALIGRKEMDMRSFSDLQQKYSSAGIPTYTEIILGLPGETYESFCTGLCRLLEAGQHNSIAVYQCQIYCNALMGNAEYQKKYGIKTARVPINSAHYIADPNGIQEYFDVVVATADMNADEWVKANMFSVVLQAFHNMGLLRCFALYLYYENGISYYKFYNLLLSYILNAEGTFLQKLFLDFKNRFDDKETGVWIYRNEKFGGTGWYFEEGAFLEILYSGDIFWNEILPFLNQFNISEELFQDLLAYQKFIIRRPLIVSASADFKYDFLNYFENIYCGEHHSLEKRKCRINISTGITASSWEEYAFKIVLGGKRRGETLYTNEKGSVAIENK